MRIVNWAALAAALVLASGCATATHVLFPKPPPPVGGPIQSDASVQGAAAGAADLQPLTMPALQPTTTFVGQKTKELAGDLSRLQSALASHGAELDATEAKAAAHAASYHALVGEIETKLQAGTTIGNPLLVDKWNLAQGQLTDMAGDVTAMGTSAGHIAADAGLSAYLLNAIRSSYDISGALDEDHANLAKLEEAANQAALRVDRLQNQVTADVQRQNSFVTAERANLTNLALAINTGRYYGESLAQRAQGAPAPTAVQGANPAASEGAVVAAGRKPLVTIRFDQAEVPFQQPLYDAVSQALARKPTVAFDLVSVAAAGKDVGEGALKASEAARQTDSVVRSLIAMGLPRERITVTPSTSATAKVNEVQIYVR